MGRSRDNTMASARRRRHQRPRRAVRPSSHSPTNQSSPVPPCLWTWGGPSAYTELCYCILWPHVLTWSYLWSSFHLWIPFDSLLWICLDSLLNFLSLLLSLKCLHSLHALSLLVYCKLLHVFRVYMLYWFDFCPWQQHHRNEILQTPYSETFLLPYLKELTAPQVIVSIYLESQIMFFLLLKSKRLFFSPQHITELWY